MRNQTSARKLRWREALFRPIILFLIVPICLGIFSAFLVINYDLLFLEARLDEDEAPSAFFFEDLYTFPNTDAMSQPRMCFNGIDLEGTDIQSWHYIALDNEEELKGKVLRGQLEQCRAPGVAIRVPAVSYENITQLPYQSRMWWASSGKPEQFLVNIDKGQTALVKMKHYDENYHYPSVVGLTLSHLRAMKMAYDTKVPYTVVFEADVSFEFISHSERKWNTSLARVIEELEAEGDWHICQIGYSLTRQEVLINIMTGNMHQLLSGRVIAKR